MKIDAAVRALAVAALLVPAAARANDRWEAGSNSDDDGVNTHNQLRPGDHQAGHDLEGFPDTDFYPVKTQLYHSYEALVRSGTLHWNYGTAACLNSSSVVVCPRFDLVNGLAVIQTVGVWDGFVYPSSSVANAMRLTMNGTSGITFLRVIGDLLRPLTAADQYDIEFHDTTYSVPRFNNSGTQTTILIVQNTTDRAIHADAIFFDAAGAMLSLSGQDLAPYATWVFPTAGIPALAGKSGSILVRQDGPHRALSGKAVALEASTGFTFDTAMTPLEP